MRSSARNVLSDEERGETDVFAGYLDSHVSLGVRDIWGAVCKNII